MRLRRAWADAWENKLTERAQEGLSKQQYGRILPSDRAVRVLFFAAFGPDASQEAQLPTRLRTPRLVFTTTEISQSEAKQITQAVGQCAARLERTSAFNKQLTAAAKQAKLSWPNRQEDLMREAFDLAGDHEVLTDELIEKSLAKLDAVLKFAKVSAFAREPDNQAELEETWRQAFARPRSPLGLGAPDFEAYSAALLPFLDDEGLAQGAPNEISEQRWQAALKQDATVWQFRTREFGLSRLSPPAPAALFETAEVNFDEDDERYIQWLDASVERRLAAILNRPRSSRAKLGEDPRPLWLQEIARTAAPLGVLEHDSRVVLALGGLVAQRAGILPETREEQKARRETLGGGTDGLQASDQVRRMFQAFRRDRAGTYKKAGFPHVWDNILVDPITFYMCYLWLRVHNDEAYSRAPYTATTAWNAVVLIAGTVIDRLKTMPTSRAYDFLAAVEDIELLEEGTSELSTPHAIALLIEVQRIQNIVGSDEFTAFFADSDATPEAQQKVWAEWTAEAGSTLSLEVISAWLDENRPPSSVVTP